MTGVNPGKHNIYDFLARDVNSCLPFLSSAEISGPEAQLENREVHHTARQSAIKGMRKGTPFWHWLGKAGVFSSVIRVPVTFPPEKFPGVLLSGMCVPDLKGSQGTFCLCTTRRAATSFVKAECECPSSATGMVFHSYIPGPENPLGHGSELRADFRDSSRRRQESGHGSKSTRKSSPSKSASTRIGSP